MILFEQRSSLRLLFFVVSSVRRVMWVNDKLITRADKAASDQVSTEGKKKKEEEKKKLLMIYKCVFIRKHQM